MQIASVRRQFAELADRAERATIRQRAGALLHAPR